MKLAFLSLLILSILLSSNQNTLFLLLLMLTMALVIWNFIKFWNHVFLLLLNLELMGLTFMFSLTMITLSSILNMELFFIFFTFAVCEASIGIAILIFFSHSKGSESMNALL